MKIYQGPPTFYGTSTFPGTRPPAQSSVNTISIDAKSDVFPLPWNALAIHLSANSRQKVRRNIYLDVAVVELAFFCLSLLNCIRVSGQTRTLPPNSRALDDLRPALVVGVSSIHAEFGRCVCWVVYERIRTVRILSHRSPIIGWEIAIISFNQESAPWKVAPNIRRKIMGIDRSAPDRCVFYNSPVR